MSLTQPWVYENTSLAMHPILFRVFGLPHGAKTPTALVLSRSLEDVIFIRLEERESYSVSESQLKQFLSEDVYEHTVRFLRDMNWASEIVGYRHPETHIRARWLSIYKDICRVLHLNFETENQFATRLGSPTEKGKSIPIGKDSKIPRIIPERPIELDIEGFPRLVSKEELDTNSICTCQHTRNTHYQMAPETAPEVFECSGKNSGGDKCKCTKFVEKDKPVILPPSNVSLPIPEPSLNPNAYCAICRHSLTAHEVPNFSGIARRCSISNCLCTQFRIR